MDVRDDGGMRVDRGRTVMEGEDGESGVPEEVPPDGGGTDGVSGVVPPDVVPPEEVVGGVTGLVRVMLTGVDVERFPAMSLATASIWYVPVGREEASQVMEYGGVVSSLPRLALFSLNWTPWIPDVVWPGIVGSEAEAETVIDEGLMVPPVPGEVMETVGGVVSGVEGVVGVDLGREQEDVVPPFRPRHCQRYWVEVSGVSERVPWVQEFRVVEQEPFVGDVGEVPLPVYS